MPRIDHPLRQAEPVQRRALGQRRQRGGHTHRHLFAGLVVFAALEDEGVARLRHLLHHHRAGHRLLDRRALFRQFRDARGCVAESGLRGGEVFAQPLLLRLVALFRRDGEDQLHVSRHRQRLRGCRHGKPEFPEQKTLSVILVDAERQLRAAHDLHRLVEGKHREVRLPDPALERPARLRFPIHGLLHFVVLLVEIRRLRADRHQHRFRALLRPGTDAQLGQHGVSEWSSARPFHRQAVIGQQFDFDCGDAHEVCERGDAVGVFRRLRAARKDDTASFFRERRAFLGSECLGIEHPPDGRGRGGRGLLPHSLSRQHLQLTRLARLARRRQLFVHLGELRVELRRRDGQHGTVVAAPREPALVHVIEEGEKLVELALRNRVVFVIVAARAAHREPEPHGARGLHAIHHVFDTPFRVDRAALLVHAMVAVEAARDFLVRRRIRQQITGELLDGELIERLVRVEGVDDPVAPAPHEALTVRLEAIAVGVTRPVEPVLRHLLAVSRRGEQSVGEALVSTRLHICDERFHLLRRRRQPGEVEAHAADERARVRLRRGLQRLAFQIREEEPVHVVARPRGILHSRHRGPRRRDECPVAFVFRTLRNPPTKHIDLRRSQRLRAGLLRGHPLVGVVARGALDEFARVRLPRHDRNLAGFRGREGVVFQIQPQLALALRLIRAVAGEAIFRKDRPHIAVEVDGRQLCLAARHCSEEGEGGDTGAEGGRIHGGSLP